MLDQRIGHTAYYGPKHDKKLREEEIDRRGQDMLGPTVLQKVDITQDRRRSLSGLVVQCVPEKKRTKTSRVRESEANEAD